MSLACLLSVVFPNSVCYNNNNNKNITLQQKKKIKIKLTFSSDSIYLKEKKKLSECLENTLKIFILLSTVCYSKTLNMFCFQNAKDRDAI